MSPRHTSKSCDCLLNVIVFVDNEGSTPISVESELIQGLGPVLFTLFLDSLLKVFPVPIFACANDIKLLVEVKTNYYNQIQGVIDVIANRSSENRLPLSIEKCSILHYGCINNPLCPYVLSGQSIKQCDAMYALPWHHSI